MKDSGNKIYFIKPVSRDANKQDVQPHFELTTKGVDGYVKEPVNLSLNVISGRLAGVEHLVREYKGTKYDEITFSLIDDEAKEIYRVGFRLNISTRSLFNSLFSLTEFDNIEIKYYRSSKGYDQYSLYQNGEKVQWKYEMDQIPKASTVKIRGVDTKDFYEVDQWYVNKLLEFLEVNQLNKKKFVSIKNEDQPDEHPVEKAVSVDTDDIPF